MTAINSLVAESLTQPIRNFMHDVHYNPDRAVSKTINVGSLAAALYHIYANTKDKDDKVSAILDSLPKAVYKAAAVATAGHVLADLSRGRYSYDPSRNSMLNKTPFKYTPPENTNTNAHNTTHNQHLTPQQQAINQLLNTISRH